MYNPTVTSWVLFHSLFKNQTNIPKVILISNPSTLPLIASVSILKDVPCSLTHAKIDCIIKREGNLDKKA
jgi:hypothetical protein